MIAFNDKPGLLPTTTGDVPTCLSDASATTDDDAAPRTHARPTRHAPRKAGYGSATCIPMAKLCWEEVQEH